MVYTRFANGVLVLVCCYVTYPLLSRGSPTLQSGGKSEVAYKWADWLHNPLPSRRSPTLQSGGQNQKRPTNGRIGYITPAFWMVPNASEQGRKLEVARE